MGNTDPKKNAARTLKAYALYLEKSAVKRPLLIADLKEEYIDALLRQEQITEIKKQLFYPGYIDNQDLAALYNTAFTFYTLPCAKVSAFPYSKPWLAALPSLQATLRPCPKWQVKEQFLSIRNNRNK